MSVEKLSNERLLAACVRIIEADARCDADTDGQQEKRKIGRQKARAVRELHKRLAVWLEGGLSDVLAVTVTDKIAPLDRF